MSIRRQPLATPAQAPANGYTNAGYMPGPSVSGSGGLGVCLNGAIGFADEVYCNGNSGSSYSHHNNGFYHPNHLASPFAATNPPLSSHKTGGTPSVNSAPTAAAQVAGTPAAPPAVDPGQLSGPYGDAARLSKSQVHPFLSPVTSVAATAAAVAALQLDESGGSKGRNKRFSKGLRAADNPDLYAQICDGLVKAGTLPLCGECSRDHVRSALLAGKAEGPGGQLDGKGFSTAGLSKREIFAMNKMMYEGLTGKALPMNLETGKPAIKIFDFFAPNLSVPAFVGFGAGKEVLGPSLGELRKYTAEEWGNLTKEERKKVMRDHKKARVDYVKKLQSMIMKDQKEKGVMSVLTKNFVQTLLHYIRALNGMSQTGYLEYTDDEKKELQNLLQELDRLNNINEKRISRNEKFNSENSDYPAFDKNGVHMLNRPKRVSLSSESSPHPHTLTLSSNPCMCLSSLLYMCLQLRCSVFGVNIYASNDIFLSQGKNGKKSGTPAASSDASPNP